VSDEARRRRSLHPAVLVVVLAAGLLLGISAATAGDSDLRAAGRTDLSELIRDRSRDGSELEQDIERLRREVDDLTASHTVTGDLTADIEALGAQSGLLAEEGPGLRVTLDDAPFPGGELPDGVTADYFIIHQQDIEAVLNALWAGGAEAVSVMGRRIISTSAVKCVGPVLLLDGAQFSPPYRIAAIGDPRELARALQESSAVGDYRAWADQLGLGYDVDAEDQLEIPAYEGSTDLSYVEGTS
jgi:uncharacterized protein YlxW (UPF0749 family)